MLFLKRRMNLTFSPGTPTAPLSPLWPLHLHGTEQHSRSAMLSLKRERFFFLHHNHIRQIYLTLFVIEVGHPLVCLFD